jgi:hypothetical protein
MPDDVTSEDIVQAFTPLPTVSDVAMDRLAEHLQYLANLLIDAARPLPDGEPWVKVAGVAMELMRLAGDFKTTHSDGSDA